MNGAYTTPLRIGARGFSVREQLLLRSLVRIAGTPLPRPWEFVEEAPYHALFSSVGADDGAAAGDGGMEPAAEGVARIPVQGPLESERIALLLDSLKQDLPRLAAGLSAFSAERAIASAAASSAIEAAAGPGHPEPADDGAAVMRRLTNRRDQTPFAWMDGVERVVVVNPATRTWYVPGLTAATPASSAVRDVAARLVRGGLRYVVLSPADIADMTDLGSDSAPDAGSNGAAGAGPDGAAASAQRLELLLWHVGLLVSPEGVLPEVRRTRRLRLARWPDFGSFGSDALQLKLSAFLVSRSYSIDELVLAAGGAGERVVAFLNACALCGLFVSDATDDRPDPRESSAPRQFGDVVRMVRSALGMAQG
jgi:hypothetical protein